jgi:hypothetical protein
VEVQVLSSALIARNPAPLRGAMMISRDIDLESVSQCAATGKARRRGGSPQFDGMRMDRTMPQTASF